MTKNTFENKTKCFANKYNIHPINALKLQKYTTTRCAGVHIADRSGSLFSEDKAEGKGFKYTCNVTRESST